MITFVESIKTRGSSLKHIFNIAFSFRFQEEITRRLGLVASDTVMSPLRAQYRRFSCTLRSKLTLIKQCNQGYQCRSLILWCSKGVRTIFATSRPYTSLSMKELTRTVPSYFPTRTTTLEASPRSHSKTIDSLESRIGQGNTSSLSITQIILRPFLIQTTKEHTIYLAMIRDKMLS